MQKRKAKKIEKPTLPLTAKLFNSLMHYFLSDFISRGFVTKLEEFFESVNCLIYEQDGDLEIYYRITRRVAAVILDENIKDVELIFSKIFSSPKDGDEISDFINNILEDEIELTSSEALFIENEFIDRLNFLNVTPLASELRVSLSKLENHDYSSFAEIVSELQNKATNLTKSITSRSTESFNIPDIDFSNRSSLMHSVRKTRDNMNNKRRLIRTGVKRLDRMLNKLQPGRVYLINAISGGLTNFSSL